MRKTAAYLLCIICVANAIEYSHRIKALGTDFAYLIPDYETDLYRNPQILSENVIGISYNRYNPYVSTPLKLIFSSKRFGVLGRYWLSYNYYQGSLSKWITSYSLYLEDIWMLKIKDYVLNIYNDGQLSNEEYSDGDLDKLLEYFIKTQSSYNLGELFNLNIKIGTGFYEKIYRYEGHEVYNNRIWIPSARIGLFFRNTASVNQFTSWFIDIGGPISAAEISSLPYSIEIDLFLRERTLKFFASTFIAKCGWATGKSINNKSFFVIGVGENLLYQKQSISWFQRFLAVTNTISLPIGIEYNVNTISIRLGTSFSYNLVYTRELHDTILRSEEIHHTLDYNRSFGFGWQPNKHLTIDLYNTGDLTDIGNWEVYLKYLF